MIPQKYHRHSLSHQLDFNCEKKKKKKWKCTGLSETANYGVSMTTITIVDSLWRHNENCCYANMRSQGQASCLLTLEFKCHLRYCSSQEVDVLLSVFLPYSTWFQLCIEKNIDGLVQDCNISIANILEILSTCTPSHQDVFVFQNGQTSHGADGVVLCCQLLHRHHCVGARLCSSGVLRSTFGGSFQQVSRVMYHKISNISHQILKL